MLVLSTHPLVDTSISWEEPPLFVTNCTLVLLIIQTKSKYSPFFESNKYFWDRPIFSIEKRIELIEKITEDLE